jgi:glycosyltransferase involved in cell wall biosynthesis
MRPPGSDRPRVAVVTHGYFPRIGGSERYHRQTARALGAIADVEVFTTRPHRSEGLPSMPRRAVVDDLPVNYLPWIPLGGERWILPWSLARALRRFEPDLLWANLPSASAALGAHRMRRRGRPWIATYQADLASDSWRNRTYARWEARLLRSAAQVFVHTDRLARRLAERGVDPGRIATVPGGPLIADGHPPAPLGSRVGDTQLPGPEASLLFVGALDRGHSYKGVDHLLQAVAQLGAGGLTVHVTLVGGGPERSVHEGVARALGITDRVRFAGRLSDEELAERYRRAWALVVPSTSRSEGFSAVAVEAAWYGCPAVISSAVESADFWRATGSALVYDDDPRGLADALRRIWTEVSLRRRLAAATAQVREELDWDRLLPRTLGPIQRLLDSRPRPAAPR